MRHVAVPVRDGDQHRRDRDRDQRELPRDDEDDDADADDREDVLEEEDEAVAEEEADALQVDGRAAHQLAGLMPVVEAEGEPHELRVERRAHVHLDGERLLAGDQPAAGHHQRARDPERDDERRRATAGVRALVAAERGDDAAGQEDRDERRRLRADREHDRDDHRLLYGRRNRASRRKVER